jgi:TBC1 domain family member 20
MVRKHPDLHYYQGYHDLVSVLVLVLTEDDLVCFAVAERISLYFARDFARESFDVLLHLMQLLFPLLRRFDPEVS